MTQADASATVDRTVGSGALHFEQVRRRIVMLSGLGINELMVPDRVSLLADEAVRVVEPQPPGTTLKAWLARSGPMSAGECVWWGVEVAAALAQLHKAGLAHGALSDEAIWLLPGGVRITHLVDGPETAEASDDVAALGSLMIASVATGERARVAAWTQPMTSTNPQARPTAAMVARALPSCAEPVPLGAAREADDASIAREARQGASMRPVEPLPEAAGWRRWRARRSVALRIASGAAAIAVVVAVSAAWWPAGTNAAAAMAAARGDESHPMRAAQGAVEATRNRLGSIATGSAEGVVALTAEGGQARADAEYVAGLFDEGRFAAEGLTYRVEGAQVIEAPHGDAASGDAATVEVTYWVSSYTSVFDGVPTAVDEVLETAQLTMKWDDSARWLVVEAEVVG